jgi:pimeloyl-ACP methyl ester carboxylesterase
VLLHGGLLAQENAPLSRAEELTTRYEVLNYHRRGFAGSTRNPGVPVSIAQQAADCIALVEHLELGRANLVGHSLGGAIALQVALDRPDLVHSLVLLEPALMGAVSKAQAAGRPDAVASQQAFAADFGRVLQIARTGDKRAALLAFLHSRAGEAFREVLDHLTASGEFEQAVQDADTFLQVEMPAAFGWPFTPADAARIAQPVLSVLGAHSAPRAHLVHDALSVWIPQTELCVLDHADHALPLMDPHGIARDIATFLDRVAARAV